MNPPGMQFSAQGRGIEYAGAWIGQRLYCLLMHALLTDSLLSNGGAVARGCGVFLFQGRLKHGHHGGINPLGNPA